MAETLIETPAGFDKLSKAEQVRYLQALWDQISEQPDDIPVPESHLKLAEERLRLHRDSPTTARSAFEVINRLSEKSK
jgi:Putative addiction module component